jgi:hypothetical protein
MSSLAKAIDMRLWTNNKSACVLGFVASIVVTNFAAVRAQPKQSAEEKGGRELISFEFGLGANLFPVYEAENDKYSKRLYDFGFAYPDLAGFRYNLATIIGLTQYLSVGIEFAQLETGDTIRYRLGGVARDSVLIPAQEFDWSVYGLFGLLRGYYWFAPWSAVYAQVGVGLGIAATTFDAISDGPEAAVVEKGETKANYALTTAAGALLELSEVFGVFLQLSISYAPVLHNELEETHETLAISTFGGLRFTIGASQ